MWLIFHRVDHPFTSLENHMVGAPLPWIKYHLDGVEPHLMIVAAVVASAEVEIAVVPLVVEAVASPVPVVVDFAEIVVVRSVVGVG